MSSSASPIHGQAQSNDFDMDVERYRLTLRGKKLTAALAFVAGTGFTLFGCSLYLLLSHYYG
jgi:hypothetical protein